jgi:hypothetical protein
MIDVDSYLSTGYHFGNVTDIFENINEFNLLCDQICNIPIDETYWGCQFVVGCDTDEFIPHIIPISLKEDRQTRAAQQNLDVIQCAYSMKRLSTVNHFFNYFQQHSTEFLKKIYHNKAGDGGNDFINCYVNGDKLNPHTDNHNESTCALVIYLSNDNYDNNGGLLNIVEYAESCVPIRGIYSLLDLTQNNLRHQVTEVTGNFRRFSYHIFASKK